MCTDGKTPIQTESGLWVMAYEGEAGDWRIWPCLLVSESGIALLTIVYVLCSLLFPIVGQLSCPLR